MKNIGTGVNIRTALAALSALVLNGCGGSDATPPPVNRAPVITSSATASVVENGTAIAWQASATDADGDPVTLSLSGTDAARFTIGATGEVRFVSPTNFEKPLDSDADNAYVVQLNATDGKATVSQSVTITVTNDREGIAVQRIATGFDHPVAIVPIAGQSQLMIAERSGAIYIHDPATGQRTLFASVEGLTNAPQQGITGLAVAPDFATRRIVYALVARTSDVAIRQIFNDGGPTSWVEFPIERRTSAATAAGGWLGFGADGRLYVATGDAGGVRDPGSSAQDANSLFGKLFSLASTGFDGFAGASVLPPIIPSVIARGLHAPAGGTFSTAGLLLPDHGQSQREEVSLVPLASATIDNLGWPFREGTSLVATGEPAGLTPPVLEYARSGGPYSGQQIVGGLVYRGGNASLAGAYLFLDAGGAIFTVPVASLRRGSTVATSIFERRDLDFAPESGTITLPTAVAQNAAGAIYITCENGDIFRVTAS